MYCTTLNQKRPDHPFYYLNLREHIRRPIYCHKFLNKTLLCYFSVPMFPKGIVRIYYITLQFKSIAPMFFVTRL